MIALSKASLMAVLALTEAEISLSKGEPKTRAMEAFRRQFSIANPHGMENDVKLLRHAILFCFNKGLEVRHTMRGGLRKHCSGRPNGVSRDFPTGGQRLSRRTAPISPTRFDWMSSSGIKCHYTDFWDRLNSCSVLVHLWRAISRLLLKVAQPPGQHWKAQSLRFVLIQKNMACSIEDFEVSANGSEGPWNFVVVKFSPSFEAYILKSGWRIPCALSKLETAFFLLDFPI